MLHLHAKHESSDQRRNKKVNRHRARTEPRWDMQPSEKNIVIR